MTHTLRRRLFTIIILCLRIASSHNAEPIKTLSKIKPDQITLRGKSRVNDVE